MQQREIKFKGTSFENKDGYKKGETVKGLYSKKPLGNKLYYFGIETDNGNFIQCKNIRQFVGLRDRQGKEIYEGDICLGYFKINDVEDYLFLSLTEKEKKEQSKIFIIEDIFYPYTNPIPDVLEVIGNIHENKNLLK